MHRLEPVPPIINKPGGIGGTGFSLLRLVQQLVRHIKRKGEPILKISIFGLGYVGTVSAGCFANDGHEIIGVDPVRTKVDLINHGQSPIVEADIGAIIETTFRMGRLRAMDDTTEAVRDTDLSFVCVGTPSQANGN